MTKKLDKVVNAGIRHEGDQITLPAKPTPMGYRAAIAELERVAKDAEERVAVTERVEGEVFDVLVAFHAVLNEKYGWVLTQGKTINTMFGPIERPAHMIDVRTGPGIEDTIQVPVGEFRVPALDDPLEVTPDFHSGALFLNTTTEKHKAGVVKELAALTRRRLIDHSIYRGRAIRMPERGDRGEQPRFIRTDHIRLDQLILSEDVQALVDVNLLTPLRETGACREFGIPLKRTVLLSGKYGTGKSLTASIVSKVSTDNRWTFVHLNDVKYLADALEFARRYQPAVIFAEDIDRALSERTDAANTILNVLDGVLSKDMEVMVVLTTNFVDKIDKAMLRPGRLDAIIEVTPPDAAAVERLVRYYARDTLSPTVDLTTVGLKLAGQIPATIREVTERSKLSMVGRKDNVLTAYDLVTAANGMGHHLSMLNGEKPVQPPELEGVFNGLVTKAVKGVLASAEFTQHLNEWNQEWHDEH